MAELRPSTPTVIALLATEAACDQAERGTPAGVHALRLNPRELLLVGKDLAVGDVDAGEPTAVVEDVTDGWAAFVLDGDDVAEAFARLSELRVPEPTGFVQGEVARVAAKVVVKPGRITILAPAMWSAHLEERIRADCAEVLT